MWASPPTEAYHGVRRGGALPRPRATARVAPTEGYKRCGGVKNPPVTASPCQPSLGKGAEGTDCHSRCAHRLRNDIVFCKECGEAGDREGRPYGGVTRGAVRRAGRCGERAERCRWQKQRSERVAAVKISSVRRKAAQKFWAPQQDHRPLRRALHEVRRGGASGKSAKRRQWRKKRADFEEVPRLAGTTVPGNRLARRWATAAPYGSVTRNAPQVLAGGVEPRPYGDYLNFLDGRCGCCDFL